MTTPTETGIGGAGGRVEIFIASAFLGSGWSVKGEDSHEGGGGLGGVGEGWKGLLERLSEERRVWGTEVYTDDSDLVGVLVHSGWVVPKFTSVASMYGGGGEAEEEEKRMRRKGGGVRVTLRMVGRLVRYVSTERNGVRSRGWGNGHDGGSLVVESVVRVEVSRVEVRNASWFGTRRADLFFLFSLLFPACSLPTSRFRCLDVRRRLDSLISLR